MQFLVSLLNWLSLSTQPDIATITYLLEKHIGSPSKSHIETAKQVIHYLKGTQQLGISFHSAKNDKLHTFVKFPIDKLTGFADANWGLQDQSVPKPNNPAVPLNSSNHDPSWASSSSILAQYIGYLYVNPSLHKAVLKLKFMLQMNVQNPSRKFYILS